MKNLILSALTAFMIPSTAFAACSFSTQSVDHTSVSAKGCNEKLCKHVVVCDGKTETVMCKGKAGTCDGYDAAECVAESKKIAKAGEFKKTEVQPDPGFGGR